jgi:hypothetical protein
LGGRERRGVGVLRGLSGNGCSEVVYVVVVFLRNLEHLNAAPVSILSLHLLLITTTLVRPKLLHHALEPVVLPPCVLGRHVSGVLDGVEDENRLSKERRVVGRSVASEGGNGVGREVVELVM